MSAKVLVSTAGMSRDDWLEWRRKGIGGSDAAAIAGLNRWRSPVAVWLEKTGQMDPEEPGEAAYWGNVLEDVVAREFAQRTGLKVQRRNAILQHPDYPFMLANVDRIIRDRERGPGILECKTTSAHRASDWEDDRVPDEYLIQVQHYLAVTGYQYGYIAVLIGGNKFVHRLIERDDELIAYLIRIESDFWSLVEAGTPPEPDGSPASTALLDKLYAQGKAGATVALPADADAFLREYDEANETFQAAKERLDRAANRLKAMLGEAELGVVGERKVRWSTVIRQSLDTKALEKDHPEICRQYLRPSTYRRFQVL